MKWEYRTYLFETHEKPVVQTAKLNELGAEGWEACFFERTGPLRQLRVWFKRPVTPA